MNSSKELEEILIEIHKEGIFEDVVSEVNNIVESDIIYIRARSAGKTSTIVNIYKKAIKNVRRNKAI